MKNWLNPRSIFGITLITVALIALPFVAAMGGQAWVRIMNFAILYIFLALGLNIVVGFAGLLDLGYIAFYAVGAYVYALLPAPMRIQPSATHFVAGVKIDENGDDGWPARQKCGDYKRRTQDTGQGRKCVQGVHDVSSCHRIFCTVLHQSGIVIFDFVHSGFTIKVACPAAGSST